MQHFLVLIFVYKWILKMYFKAITNENYYFVAIKSSSTLLA